MKKIELYKGIKSSVLGFGCAPILGSKGARSSREAVYCALDQGVNHFDLARSYGYGDAEKFIGKILKGERNNIIISSKFGIKANLKAKTLAPFKPIIRELLSYKKRKNSHETNKGLTGSKDIADRFHNRITLNSYEMKKSLEESLRALKTNYLDYFFIHEPIELIKNIDELIDCAEELKKEGKIRAFGIAFMQEQKLLHENYINKVDIIQFNNSPGNKNYESLIYERGDKSNIFFSTLNGGNSELSVEDKLKKLHHDFPNSVMLCSMFNKIHIKNNCKIFK